MLCFLFAKPSTVAGMFGHVSHPETLMPSTSIIVSHFVYFAKREICWRHDTSPNIEPRENDDAAKRLNKSLAGNAGWRLQFRYRGGRHQPRVPELDVSYE